MKISLYPEPAQIAALLANDPGGPVVMVNLLRFKAQATAPDEGVTGMEAYMRYGQAMSRLVAERGGRIIYSGRVTSQVIGESDESWDVIALMEYPSRQAFVAIAQSPEVREIGIHRAAGLEGQWLIATTQAG